MLPNLACHPNNLDVPSYDLNIRLELSLGSFIVPPLSGLTSEDHGGTGPPIFCQAAASLFKRSNLPSVSWRRPEFLTPASTSNPNKRLENTSSRRSHFCAGLSALRALAWLRSQIGDAWALQDRLSIASCACRHLSPFSNCLNRTISESRCQSSEVDPQIGQIAP